MARAPPVEHPPARRSCRCPAACHRRPAASPQGAQSAGSAQRVWCPSSRHSWAHTRRVHTWNSGGPCSPSKSWASLDASSNVRGRRVVVVGDGVEHLGELRAKHAAEVGHAASGGHSCGVRHSPSAPRSAGGLGQTGDRYVVPSACVTIRSIVGDCQLAGSAGSRPRSRIVASFSLSSPRSTRRRRAGGSVLVGSFSNHNGLGLWMPRTLAWFKAAWVDLGRLSGGQATRRVTRHWAPLEPTQSTS